MANTIGLVTIGRNEGERLRRCLQSALAQGLERIVYVDSGSTDGSPDLARSLGVDVLPLDLSIPFTAARARNAGFEHLCRAYPDIEFVQFMDGDCELMKGWLREGSAALEANPDVAVVFGGRGEQCEPQCSIALYDPNGRERQRHGDGDRRRKKWLR